MAYLQIARMILKEAPKLAKSIAKSNNPTKKKVADNLSSYIKSSYSGTKNMTSKTLKREVRGRKRELQAKAKKK